MLKDKKALEQYLEQQCDRIVVDNDLCKYIYTYANETYDIPKGIVSDLISRRKTMAEATEFELFILLDSMHNVIKDDKKIQGIDKFYAMQEAQYYRKSKYENTNIKFPLIFKMIQIEEDQWSGKIDVKTLMQLRQAQLINYNVNAQRTMQKIIKGDKESYKITLNQKAVSEIASGYVHNTFIPNTITLNIPAEIDSEFYYDEDSCSLVIKSLDHFDITDGYHRYIAACQVSDSDNNFDYNMELRIVNFTEDKAKQFIFQEDQKTKMRKVDSNSMNMNKAANIVVTRLNESIRCNLKGLINRNQGLINFGEMAMLVDWFYIKNNKKKGSSNAIQLEAIKELTENINILTESNTKYLEEQWNYLLLLSAMCVFDYCKNNNFDRKNMASLVDKVFKELSNSNNNKLKNRIPRKVLVEYVNKVIEENV